MQSKDRKTDMRNGDSADRRAKTRDAQQGGNALEQWTRAATSTNQADPFCSTPAWQLSFHEVLNPELQLLAYSAEGSMVAFAVGADPVGEVVLLPVERHWMFGCPLLGPRAVELLKDILGSLRASQGPEISRIIVSGVRPGGALSARLRKYFGDSHRINAHATGTQCGASLAGGLDGYLSRRSANHRRNLKRERLRALDRGVWFERVLPVRAEEMDALYARILAVELQSWKGLGGCGMESGFSRRFYDRMLRRLAPEGRARIIFAKHEDRDIGFVFGGLAGKVYRGQQFSYVNDWKEYSIGNLLQMEQIAWLCEEGAVRYDLGPITGEKMEYKRHWAEKRFPLEARVLERK
ncbi:MAG: GNAT family N-acetyltransferase [Desulfovibrio sp.]